MKLRLEIDENLEVEEVVIKGRQLNDEIVRLQKLLAAEIGSEQKIVCSRDNSEFYLPVSQIMFFETQGADTMAHTAGGAFKADFRLYELEGMLPGHFVRISKSTILNIDFVFSIDKNLASSSVVALRDSHKQVYVSRHYYKLLKDKLDEKRFLK